MDDDELNRGRPVTLGTFIEANRAYIAVIALLLAELSRTTDFDLDEFDRQLAGLMVTSEPEKAGTVILRELRESLVAMALDGPEVGG